VSACSGELPPTGTKFASSHGRSCSIVKHAVAPSRITRKGTVRHSFKLRATSACQATTSKHGMLRLQQCPRGRPGSIQPRTAYPLHTRNTQNSSTLHVLITTPHSTLQSALRHARYRNQNKAPLTTSTQQFHRFHLHQNTPAGRLRSKVRRAVSGNTSPRCQA